MPRFRRVTCLLPLLIAACGGRNSDAGTAMPDSGAASDIDASVDAAKSARVPTSL
jgi:hypothetical protein